MGSVSRNSLVRTKAGLGGVESRMCIAVLRPVPEVAGASAHCTAVRYCTVLHISFHGICVPTRLQARLALVKVGFLKGSAWEHFAIVQTIISCWRENSAAVKQSSRAADARAEVVFSSRASQGLLIQHPKGPRLVNFTSKRACMASTFHYRVGRAVPPVALHWKD